ncbi:GTP-binding protein Di-Ras2-like [Glandiceps talaboti]
MVITATFIPLKVILQMDMVDTSGFHSFPAMRRLAIQKARIFVLVYAIDDLESFIQLQYIYKEIREERREENLPIIVVGNKTDLQGQREIAPDEVEMVFKKRPEIDFLETSAKDDDNIDLLFERIFHQEVMRKGI